MAQCLAIQLQRLHFPEGMEEVFQIYLLPLGMSPPPPSSYFAKKGKRVLSDSLEKPKESDCICSPPWYSD